MGSGAGNKRPVGRGGASGEGQAEREHRLLERLGLLVAIVVGVAAFVQCVNRGLDGPVLIVLGVVALLGTFAWLHAERRHAQRHWLRGAAGICVTAIVLVAVFGPAEAIPDEGQVPHDATAPDATSIRASFMQTEPELWAIGFARAIAMPSERTGWRELLQQGGAEIGSGRFEFTFVNRSNKRISISGIRAEVTGARSAPTAASASIYAKGEEPRSDFVAELPAATDGAAAPFHRVDADQAVPLELDKAPVFAPISLEPGDEFRGSVTLSARPELLLDYRFVTTVTTADREEFEIADDATRQLSGLVDTGEVYDRYYHLGYTEQLSQSSCPAIRVTRWSDAESEHCPESSAPAPASAAPDAPEVGTTTSATTAGPAEVVVFHTPGSASCRVTATGAACTIASLGITFAFDGAAGYKVRQVDLPRGSGRAVAWGEPITVGDVTCQVPEIDEPRGVTCISAATGHGFEASRLPTRQRVF